MFGMRQKFGDLWFKSFTFAANKTFLFQLEQLTPKDISNKRKFITDNEYMKTFGLLDFNFDVDTQSFC